MPKITVEGICKYYDRTRGNCTFLQKQTENLPSNITRQTRPSQSHFFTPQTEKLTDSYLVAQIRCDSGLSDGFVANWVAQKQESCSKYEAGSPITKRHRSKRRGVEIV